MIATDLAYAEWEVVLVDTKLNTVLSDRLTHHYRIVETGNDTDRSPDNTIAAKSCVFRTKMTADSDGS